MKRVLILALLAVLVVLSSCNDKPQPVTPPSDSELKESLERANRYLANDEEEDIQNYILRHQWDMVSTGTGMRYQIVKEGKGPLVQPGQLVTMEYMLLDIFGDVVYSSEKDGLMRFVVGQGGAVDGIDEAVRHFRKGDIARVIVPSHLGYGLVGDQKDVPGRATLIYSLKVIEVH